MFDKAAYIEKFGLDNYVYIIYCDIASYKKWILDATSPKSYFTNFMYCFYYLSDLQKYEQVYNFDYYPPSQELSFYRSRYSELTDDFLFRAWRSTLEKAAMLKTLSAKEKRVLNFFKDLGDYSDYLSDENRLTLEILRSHTVDYENLPVRTPPLRLFDTEKETELLNAVKSADKWVSKYYAINDLLDFYYLYRNQSDAFTDKCIKLCEYNISILPFVDEEYINDRLSGASKVYKGEELKIYIQEIKARGFYGTIPAYDKLSMIFYSKGDYKAAIEVCEADIKRGSQPEKMQKRIVRLRSKLNKQLFDK